MGGGLAWGQAQGHLQKEVLGSCSLGNRLLST